MKICIRCLVSGRVQMVGFRAAAREQARRLDLSGSARNLSDGRVEVTACGQEQAVAELRAWLARGPRCARVSGVQCEPLPARGYQGFRIV